MTVVAKKTSKIALAQVAGALKSAAKYLESITPHQTPTGRAAKLAQHRQHADKFISDVAKYLNKNGTLSKRALRYNKARKDFNKIVADYHAGQKFAKRQNAIDRQIKSTMIKNGRVANKEQADDAIQLFKSKSVQYLMDNCGLDSMEIISYTEEGVSIGDLLKMADYFKNKAIAKAPSVFADEFADDDLVLAIDNFIQAIKNTGSADAAINMFEGDVDDDETI